MPTYQYRCTSCDAQFELRQSFTDDPVALCPDRDCGGQVKKVFGSVGIAFKGTGFYKNDSRSNEVSKSSDSSSAEGSNKTSGASEADKGSSSDTPAEKPSKSESSTTPKD